MASLTSLFLLINVSFRWWLPLQKATKELFGQLQIIARYLCFNNSKRKKENCGEKENSGGGIVEKANIPFSVKQKPRFSFPLLAALLRSLIDYAASWQMMIMILKLLVVKMIMVSMNISLMNKLTSLKALPTTHPRRNRPMQSVELPSSTRFFLQIADDNWWWWWWGWWWKR